METPQSCMLVVANNLLEAEATVKAKEREKFLADKCPPLELPYSKDELVVRRTNIKAAVYLCSNNLKKI